MDLPASPPTREPDGVRDAVAAIWERRKDAILARVTVLDDAVVALLEGDLSDALRGEAAREAHKLAGSVGTFGFAEGSRLAAELERLFGDTHTLDHEQVPRLATLVESLRRELERPRPSSTPSLFAGPDAAVGPAPARRPLVLVADDDEDFTTAVAAVAAGAGLEAVVAAPGSGARELVERHRPDVVLLGLGSPDDGNDSLALVGELSTREPTIPVLVVTTRNAFDDQVQAARRGAVGFLEKTLSPAQVVEAVQQAVSRAKDLSATVLTVDDDPALLEGLTALLAPAGLDVRTLDDPLKLFDVVEETSPDLLIMDFDLPHANGGELCRALRNNPRWASLPVLFLTGHSDSDTVRRALEAGGDDYLTKPVSGPDLLATITNRLERVRLLRQFADTDALTGLFNRRRSTELLDRYVRIARRSRGNLCLAVLDLDHFKSVNDRCGHATGDEVLRRFGELLTSSFRGEDVVARWGGDEFVVGMYGSGKEHAERRIAALLEDFRRQTFYTPEAASFTVAFSAGLAEYSNDGTDVPTLYRSADRALADAKTAGGSQVSTAGEESLRDADPDVVLVEDDEVLAGLVLHSLQTQGYTARWLRDGQEAAEVLRGSLAPRVVLLDWDLPGLNGLGVLGSMADAGALARTRAIMLTGRSTESEVLEALELGAYDHVAKPFSVPVLMQRIRRALMR